MDLKNSNKKNSLMLMIKKTIFLFLTIVSFHAIGATYIVTKTTDIHAAPIGGVSAYSNTSGELRWAIYQANLNPGLDIIQFNITNSLNVFPVVINLAPTGIYITDDIQIDGNSQQAGTAGQLPFFPYTGNEAKIKIIGSNSGKTSSFSILGGTHPDYQFTGIFYVKNTNAIIGSKFENIMFSNLLMAGNPYGFGLYFENSAKNLVKGCIFDELTTGVILSGKSIYNQVKANYFGTDKSLLKPNNKMSVGVYFFSATLNGNIVYPNDNIIGGGNVADKNYFYNIFTPLNGSAADAIRVYEGKQNQIRHNLFVKCTKNINLLYPNCVVSNPGASNNCKAIPFINSAVLTVSGATTTVTISGTASGGLGNVVEVYKTNATQTDAVEYLGIASVAASNKWMLVLTNPNLMIGDKIVATVTDKDANTSEFTPQPVIGITGCNSCSAIDFINAGNKCPNNPITFTPSVSSCNFTDPSVWRWDFGDGTPPTTNNVHTFTSTGTFNVKYYTPAVGACPEVKKINPITINNCVQSVGCSNCTDFSFFFPGKVCKGEEIVFVSYITGCNKPPKTTPVWGFGDGSLPTSDPSHIYTVVPQSGSYVVTMSIPGYCTTTRSVSIVDCPEISCDPSVAPCTAPTSVSVALASSPVSNPTAGTYSYTATATPAGTYTYLWTVSSNATITSGATSSTVNITKPVAGSVTLTVTVSSTTGTNCYITKIFEPCENMAATITQLGNYQWLGSSTLPSVKYKANITTANIPVASAYSYIWSVSSTPPTATNINQPLDPKNELKVALTGGSQTDPLIDVSCIIAETNNGSNGCAVVVAQSFLPCSAFNPDFAVTGTGVNLTCTANGYSGPDTDYNFTWLVTTSSGSITSGQGTKQVVVNCPAGTTVVVKLTMEQKNTLSTKCKKEKTRTIQGGD